MAKSNRKKQLKHSKHKEKSNPALFPSGHTVIAFNDFIEEGIRAGNERWENLVSWMKEHPEEAPETQTFYFPIQKPSKKQTEREVVSFPVHLELPPYQEMDDFFDGAPSMIPFQLVAFYALRTEAARNRSTSALGDSLTLRADFKGVGQELELEEVWFYVEDELRGKLYCADDGGFTFCNPESTSFMDGVIFSAWNQEEAEFYQSTLFAHGQRLFDTMNVSLDGDVCYSLLLAHGQTGSYEKSELVAPLPHVNMNKGFYLKHDEPEKSLDEACYEHVDMVLMSLFVFLPDVLASFTPSKEGGFFWVPTTMRN